MNLDDFFGPKTAPPPVQLSSLPKRAFGINVRRNRVTIEMGAGVENISFFGEAAEFVSAALKSKQYQPKAPGRSRNSAPVRWAI